MDQDLQKQFDLVNRRFDKSDERFDNLVEFLQENMATKDDLKNMATKDDLTHLEGSLRQEMHAGFDQIHATLSLIRMDLDDVKARLERVERRTIEDSAAAAKDILELRSRIGHLENQVKNLELRLAQ